MNDETIKKALEIARKIKPLVVWWDEVGSEICPECGGVYHRIGCRVVQTQIRLEEQALEILKTRPDFEKLSLDRQGELSVEIAARLTRNLQQIHMTILGQLEDLVDEYLEEELKGWK